MELAGGGFSESDSCVIAGERSPLYEYLNATSVRCQMPPNVGFNPIVHVLVVGAQNHSRGTVSVNT